MDTSNEASASRSRSRSRATIAVVGLTTWLLVSVLAALMLHRQVAPRHPVVRLSLVPELGGVIGVIPANRGAHPGRGRSRSNRSIEWR